MDFNSNLNEQQLTQLYNNLSQEHATLLNSLMKEEIGTKRERTMGRVLNTINSLMNGVRKLQQLKKDLSEM
jgi:hypothetical protein